MRGLALTVGAGAGKQHTRILLHCDPRAVRAMRSASMCGTTGAEELAKARDRIILISEEEAVCRAALAPQKADRRLADLDLFQFGMARSGSL